MFEFCQPSIIKIGDEVEAEIEGWYYKGVVASCDETDPVNPLFKIRFANSGWNEVSDYCVIQRYERNYTKKQETIRH